ncbi:MAG TPA: serine/threonine-protein kinase [Solirubrobacteraceae bacterium]|nr:serine/threonine-protein kinase [Solirubrobacteraceae bacterium]
MDSHRTLLARRAPPDPTLEAPTRRIVGRPASGAAVPGELVLERYRLHQRLGAGGFGVVWRATDELLQREVALKRIPLGAGGDGERAMREAHACARLSHPAIVALYEASVRDGAMYLTSELVEGRTLAGLITDGNLPDRQVFEIGIALCGALAHAHARGVIHRDLKPHNVLVPDRVEQPLQAAKLTDFGGASLAGEDVLTRTGDVLGTLAYMAPEQSEGKPAAEPADLYSLTLVLYEALSGVNPVRGATPAETARRIGRAVEPLARHRPDLPPALTGAIDTALATSPHARGGLAQLRSALEHAHGQSGEAATRGTLDPRAEVQPQPAAEVQPRAEVQPDPRAQVQPQPVAQPAEPSRAGVPRRLALAGLVALCCWEAIAGRAGLSLVLLAALVPALVVLTGHGRSARVPFGRVWCLLAPVLGTVGLAGAFPAVAGQSGSSSERAMRGALGYWWLTLAGPLLSARLWLPAPTGTPATPLWEESVGQAATHVVGPALSVGVLLGALLWAGAAMVLPWIVRGREPLLDAIAAGLWALALVLAQPMLDAGPAASAHPQPRGAVLGALLGACVALAGRALRGPAARPYA